MDPYAQLLMGNALLGPQTNSDFQSEPLGKRDAITATKSAPATKFGAREQTGCHCRLGRHVPAWINSDTGGRLVGCVVFRQLAQVML